MEIFIIQYTLACPGAHMARTHMADIEGHVWRARKHPEIKLLALRKKSWQMELALALALPLWLQLQLQSSQVGDGFSRESTCQTLFGFGVFNFSLLVTNDADATSCPFINASWPSELLKLI